jgi:hypothetical protein
MCEYAIDQNGISLVTDTVLLTGAVTRQVADLAAVVALLSLGAVTGEMAWRIYQQTELHIEDISGYRTVTTAGVASLSTITGTVTLRSAVATTTVRGALAGDVANLAALVALSSSRASRESTLLGSSAGVGALAREMTYPCVSEIVIDRIGSQYHTGETASVAGLLLHGTSALAAHVSILCTEFVSDRDRGSDVSSDATIKQDAFDRRNVTYVHSCSCITASK